MDTVSDNASPVSPAEKLSAAARPSLRSCWAPIAPRFRGAFNDNILRNLLLSMIVGMNLATIERETFDSVVTLLFSVPFLILSMPGGWRIASASANSRSSQSPTWHSAIYRYYGGRSRISLFMSIRFQRPVPGRGICDP